MHRQRPSKWSAFLLSLAVPGAGQLLAGSPTALIWFAAVGLLAALFTLPVLDGHRELAIAMELPMLIALSLLSARHALRLLEFQPPWPFSGTSHSSVHCARGRGRAIQAEICITTSTTAQELWRRISDIETFLIIDPFHERVTLMRDAPAAGVDLVLHHNAFGRRFDRFGRILWWREGEGFAISDLSARDAQAGFPHIFEYRIEENIDATATLRVEVKGRWTSRVIPTFIGRRWIAAVCRYHASLLRSAL